MIVRIRAFDHALKLEGSNEREQKALDRFFENPKPNNEYPFKIKLKPGIGGRPRINLTLTKIDSPHRLTINSSRENLGNDYHSLLKLAIEAHDLMHPCLIFYAKQGESLFFRYSGHSDHLVEFHTHNYRLDSIWDKQDKEPQLSFWPTPIFTNYRYEIEIHFYLGTDFPHGRDIVSITFRSYLPPYDGHFNPWVEIRNIPGSRFEEIVSKFKAARPNGLSPIHTKEKTVFRANLSLPENEAEFVDSVITTVRRFAESLGVPQKWIQITDIKRKKIYLERHTAERELFDYLKDRHKFGWSFVSKLS